MSDPALLEQLSQDRALASVLLFPHRHPQEEAPMHIEIMDLMRAADEFLILEAFREAGKTTKAEEHIILGGCFRNYNYCLWGGETYEKAVQRLAAIDYECRWNEQITAIFGKILARKSIENKMWFASGAHIQIFGWEQELQSYKHGTHRPDLVFLDDVENKENTRDKESVDESMRKLHYDLMPALDAVRRKIIFSQTRRAEDCMVTRLAGNQDWLYRGYPICDRDPDDPEAKAIWPQRYSMEWIRKEKAKYQRAGMLSGFLQMYMLQTTNAEEKPFKESMLAEMAISPYHWMPRYAIYDPSRSTNEKRKGDEIRKSDRCGKVVVSRMGSKILVHESGGEYWKPSDMIDDVFATQEKHNPVKTAIETNSLNEWLMQPLRERMLREGTTIPLKALTAPQDRSKEQFILGMEPYIKAKDVVLVGGKLAHPQLVAEIVNFPNGTRDVFNALAYSLKTFAGIPMYEDFSAANIGEAPDPKLGETVHVGITATANETAAVAVLREGRRLCVAADFTATGPTLEAVKTVVFAIRSTFPRAKIEAWIPAEVFDQASRIALLPALRTANIPAYRGAIAAVSRGSLSDRLRTTWHNKRMLTVDNRAKGVLNSLSAGYALPLEKGDRPGKEPEQGVSRMIAEALECLVAMLDRMGEEDELGFPKGANVAYNPQGHAFVTANPRAR